MRVRNGIVVGLLVVGACLGLVSPLAAKEKEPKVSELLKDANEMMSQAQSAYVDGESKKALELYRKALEEIARVEKDNPKRVSSSEFAPIRFRKALCETEIDRILLEEVSATARTVAVTDTRALAAKRAERKKAAETNNVPEAVVKLSVKDRATGVVEVKPEPPAPEPPKPEPVKETAAKPVPEKPLTPETADASPLEAKKEVAWVRELLSLNRFDEAEKSLIRVLRLAPEDRDGRFLMALVQVRQGKYADALVVMDDLLADLPSDEPTLLLASGAHMALGHYPKAMTVLDQAMKANPKRPDGYLNMAWLLLAMNASDTKDAELYYRQSVKLGGRRDGDIERRLGIRPN